MLYDKNPKTTEEIQQDLNRYIEKNKKIVKYMWLILALSIPIHIFVLVFPQVIQTFMNISVAVVISATLLTMPLSWIFLFTYLIPNNSHFHYILLQPVNEKRQFLCKQLLSHESMKPWKEYVDKVTLSGRIIYNYEYDAIYEYWNHQNNQ